MCNEQWSRCHAPQQCTPTNFSALSLANDEMLYVTIARQDRAISDLLLAFTRSGSIMCPKLQTFYTLSFTQKGFYDKQSATTTYRKGATAHKLPYCSIMKVLSFDGNFCSWAYLIQCHPFKKFGIFGWQAWAINGGARNAHGESYYTHGKGSTTLMGKVQPYSWGGTTTFMERVQLNLWRRFNFIWAISSHK